MQITIDIPKDLYADIKETGLTFREDIESVSDAIKKGVVFDKSKESEGEK